jgi:hypothetical protein
MRPAGWAPCNYFVITICRCSDANLNFNGATTKKFKLIFKLMILLYFFVKKEKPNAVEWAEWR